MTAATDMKWDERPVGWTHMPMRRIVDVRLSNVDKKILPGQREVKLCNYTDVYHGSYLESADHFMTATATENQIRRFQLQVGDVLITKDSESNEDIARPALVSSPLDSTICGYHLALLRPRSISGAYLYWALESLPINSEFTVRANGVTRFGLSSQAIKQALIPVPPRDVQLSIARFLEATTARIDKAIAAKKRLVQLLQEERQALILEAVTRGNADAEMKPSGLDWVSEVPSHWPVVRLGSVLEERGATNSSRSEPQVLSVVRGRGVIPYEEKGAIGNRKSEDTSRYKIVKRGDIVVNSMNVIIGSVGVAPLDGCLSPVYYVLKGRAASVSTDYYGALFDIPTFHKGLVRWGNGILAHRMRIPMEHLKSVPVPLPPASEQRSITAHLNAATSEVDAALSVTRRQIELLEEYRTVLIADAVTGKLDLSAADSRTPDTVAEEAVEAAAAGEPS